MIAALVPTRRPENLERLFDCAKRTGTSQVTWFVGLDEDDEQNYPRHDGVRYVVAPQAQLTVKTNELAAAAWDEFPILAQFDDDQWPRTPKWDLRVIDAMQDLGGGLVYTDDGWMGEQTPVCPFWPSRFAKQLGWLYHPSLIHLFCDNTLKELALAIGRIRYLSDVLIEHVHPIVGKSEWDESYKQSNSGVTWAHDEQAFGLYVGSQRFRDDVRGLEGLL